MSLPSRLTPTLTAPALVAALLLAVPLAAAPPVTRAAPPASAGATLQQAQTLVDQGKPQAALPLLDTLLRQDAGNALALLLRSTARFLTDDLTGGRTDLDRALELDPGLRQGWLNRAGLEIAGKRYDQALSALERAEKLDPRAADNDLNIGAVLLLKGQLEPASQRFNSYLAKPPGAGMGPADAPYLVATNYAMAGYASLAVESLRRAIDLDERSRLRARTDSNFASLGRSPRFQELLATDSWQPPPGALVASRTYEVPYDEEDGLLLSAVLEALRSTGERVDPRVESAAAWALIWGQDLRVKVSRGADGKGLVEVSARAGLASAPQWRDRTDKLFQTIAGNLLSRQKAGLKKKP